MGIPPQGPAAGHVHEPPHSNSDTLSSGFAIMPPSRIAAQPCAPVVYATMLPEGVANVLNEEHPCKEKGLTGDNFETARQAAPKKNGVKPPYSK